MQAQAQAQAQQRGPGPQFSVYGNAIGSKPGGMGPAYGPGLMGLTQPDPEPNWVVKVESDQFEQQLKQQGLEPLEEDYIEQMIEELLDYGTIEIAV